MEFMNAKNNQLLIGIVGRDLRHTLSPLMHTTAYKKLNVDYKYGIFQVEPKMVQSLIGALRSMNFRGANVTVPYKQAVMPFLDEITDEARIIGAVNTIVNVNNRLIGYNTDVYGIHQSLVKFTHTIKENNIVLFGAGGTARAAIYAVAKYFSPQQVTIVNRTESIAQSLAEEFGRIFPSTIFKHLSVNGTIKQEIDNAVLIINTTSLGMNPHSHGTPIPGSISISKNHVVFDVVYTPLETTLLRDAAVSGAQTISGIEMLLEQGAKAFELFTNLQFPMEAARMAVIHELTQDKQI